MPRFWRTGTGPGTIVGRGRIELHTQVGRVIERAAIHWSGEATLVPWLPGLAFDENLPDLRAIPGDGSANTLYGPGRTRWGKEAQKVMLAEFTTWSAEAQQRFEAGLALPTFGVITLADRPQSERVVDQIDYVVRVNERKARLWMETAYTSDHARSWLFAYLHQVFWDWIASGDRNGGAAVMLAALSKQMEYYRLNGIPADFMLRQVGRAPFDSWSVSRPA